MTDNTGEETSANEPGINEESDSSKILSKETVNTTETDDITDTDNTPLHKEEENIEVHHHSHHKERKKWKSYFWEFLMLFLAVLCGFLAEYQLEHVIERDRAKELSKSFYQELISDSITAGVKVKNRLKQEAALEYLIKYFRDSSLTNVPKEFALNFEYGISFRSPSQFEPRTIMLEQLRSSGSLRYFKNDELQKLTGELTVAIKNIYDRQELESQNRLQYINPIIIQHYDYDFDAKMKNDKENVFEGVEKYSKSTETIPFRLKQPEKTDRQNVVNILSFYNGNVVNPTRRIHLQKYIEINAGLLKVLRKEYNLK